jgi:hypothetical protein
MTTHHSPFEAETKQTLPEENPPRKVETTADLEPAEKPDPESAPRPTPLTWLFVCIGLYLGALLYGEKPSLAPFQKSLAKCS